MPGPPRLALLLLRLFVRGEAREFIEGDLREEYGERVASPARVPSARRWFWRQALSTVLSRVGSAFRRSAGAEDAPLRSSGEREARRSSLPGRGGPVGSGGGGLRADVRMAARALARRPGFSFVVVVILAVGVGATTSVYSVADWLLLRPVPGVGAPTERLVLLQAERPDGNYTGISYPNLRDLEAGAFAIGALAGTAPTGVQVAGDGMEPSTLRAESVTGGYFEILEVGAHLGRLFSSDELAPDAESPVVVVSHRVWKDHLRADPGVVGRELAINGARYTVIGVAAEGFRGIDRAGDVDLWFPAALYPRLRHYPTEDDHLGRTRRSFMQTVARLAPGASPEQAETQLRDVMARLVVEYPDANEIHEEYRPTVHGDIGTSPTSRDYLGKMVTIMFAVAGMLLLIACANVANLLIFHGARVQGDVAVRRALGASRLRIVRQHLAEALILAVFAGVMATGVAWGLNEIFWRGGGFFGFAALSEAPLDARVLLFALATAVSVPLLFALVPAVLSSRTDVASRLQASRPTGTVPRARLRGALTVFQLSLSLALAVGSFLLLRTVDGLSEVDPGFDPEGLMVFSADPEPQGYSRQEGVRFGLALLERAKQIPGVRATTVARWEPFFPSGAWGRVVVPSARGDAETMEMQYEWIGPEYFSTLGVPLLAGRGFESHEMEPDALASAEVVLLNETLAVELFGSTDVVGRTVTIDGYRERTDKRVVGVVPDIPDDFRSVAVPTLYEPLPSSWGSETTLLLRTERTGGEVARQVRTALQAVDPNVPLFRSLSMADAMAAQMAEERMLARLLGILALLAGGLAAAGLYAIVAWTVSERTREIGIRIAMGAEPGRIVRWIVGGAAWLAVGGVLLGFGASVWVARLLESRLFGVEPFDPSTWGGAALLLLFAAACASAQPALRATSIRPVEALRAE